jgi:UDP-N-acetylmuramyl pentapeptide phosphotransferase/UDP-N-acetylglucosamine-1-phosphate transferase
MFVTWLIMPKIKEMLEEANFLRPNFRKENIPLGVGLVFFLSSLLVLTLGNALGLVGAETHSFLFAIGGMGLFGLIDDVFGTRGASGLMGHFKKLFIQREITTGALKALAGGVIAFFISLGLVQGSGLTRWVLVIENTLIIALSTNAINLLDLRPGRAAKGFLVTAAFVTILGIANPPLLCLAVVAGSVIAFIREDLKARAMMGDTGSNMLGMTLGYTAVYVFDGPLKLGFLILLIGFHLVTERYSLTKIIEKNRFLNYLDMLGRE